MCASQCSSDLCLVEMAVIEALASFVATQPFALFVPFAHAKDGRLRFRLPHKKRNNPIIAAKMTTSDYSCLVEMAVIETASENPFTQLSPGAVNLLGFPQKYAG